MSHHVGYNKTKEALLDEYFKQGLSISQIAAKDGVTTTTVRRAFDKYEIRRKPKGNERTHSKNTAKRLTDSIKNTITNLLLQGDLTIAEIASNCDVTATTVYAINKQLGNVKKYKQPLYKQYSRETFRHLYYRYSTYEIADLLQTDVQAVLYALNKYSITILANDKRSQKCKDVPLEIYDKIDDPVWLENNRHRQRNDVAVELNISVAKLNYFIRKHSIRFRMTTRSSTEYEVCLLLDSLNIDYVTNNRIEMSSKQEIDILTEHCAIEINGEFFHNINHPRITVDYHKNKSLTLFKRNIPLYHLWYNNWMFHKNAVLNELKLLTSVEHRMFKHLVVSYPQNANTSTEIKDFVDCNSVYPLDNGTHIVFSENENIQAILVIDGSVAIQWIQHSSVNCIQILEWCFNNNINMIHLRPPFFIKFNNALKTFKYELSMWSPPKKFWATKDTTRYAYDEHLNGQCWTLYDEGEIVVAMRLE